MLYAGTAVVAGRGTAVVVATGADTAAGRTADGARAPRIGVQARLESLSAGAMPVALGASAPSSQPTSPGAGPLPETLATGVILAVAAVPEGLTHPGHRHPTGRSKRLAAHGVLVRNARTVEAHDGLRGATPTSSGPGHQHILAELPPPPAPLMS